MLQRWCFYYFAYNISLSEYRFSPNLHNIAAAFSTSLIFFSNEMVMNAAENDNKLVKVWKRAHEEYIAQKNEKVRLEPGFSAFRPDAREKLAIIENIRNSSPKLLYEII